MKSSSPFALLAMLAVTVPFWMADLAAFCRALAQIVSWFQPRS